MDKNIYIKEGGRYVPIGTYLSLRLVHTTLKILKDIQNESKQHLCSGKRGSSGTAKKKQGIGRRDTASHSGARTL